MELKFKNGSVIQCIPSEMDTVLILCENDDAVRILESYIKSSIYVDDLNIFRARSRRSLYKIDIRCPDGAVIRISNRKNVFYAGGDIYKVFLVKHNGIFCFDDTVRQFIHNVRTINQTSDIIKIVDDEFNMFDWLKENIFKVQSNYMYEQSSQITEFLDMFHIG